MRRRHRVAGPRRKVARTRGAASGILLVLLGIWGALIPFVGPYFNFSFTPDTAWTWSAARGWLEVLPGAVAVAGGLLLLVSTSRVVTLLGAWLAVAGGAWFVVGPQLAVALHIGSPGQPAGTGNAVRAAEALALFYGLGAAIVFIAAAAFGRLSLVSPRDVRAAEQREQLAADEAAAAQAQAQAVPAQTQPAVPAQNQPTVPAQSQPAVTAPANRDSGDAAEPGPVAPETETAQPAGAHAYDRGRS